MGGTGNRRRSLVLRQVWRSRLFQSDSNVQQEPLRAVRKRWEDTWTRYQAEQALVSGTVLVDRFISDLDALAEADPNSTPWLTTEHFADLFDVTPGTVRTWCTEGKLDGAIKLDNGVWRIPVTAVDAFTASRSKPGRGSQLALA